MVERKINHLLSFQANLLAADWACSEWQEGYFKDAIKHLVMFSVEHAVKTYSRFGLFRGLRYTILDLYQEAHGNPFTRSLNLGDKNE